MPGAPFNPVTGQRAQMGSPPSPGTILSMFQVIGDTPSDATTEDTHENYVVCRGFEPDIDPFFRYLHDPYTKPETKSIKVAKPYAVRGTYPYKRSQVIVAARIRTRLGDNQGKAHTSVGYPENLDEETDLLFDDDNVAIAWLDITTVPQGVRFFNNCGATYPAWGISRITGRTAASGAVPEYRTVAKVDDTYRWQYFVNGGKDVDDQKYGYGFFLDDHDGEVLYDTGSTPAYGERWGPKADSFLIWQHRPGFFITGGATGSGATSRVGAKQIVPGEVRLQNDTGGAIAAGGTGTLGIYGGAAGTTDTGLEVSITNGSSVSWATTKYGWATADAGGLIFGAPHQT